MAQILTKANEPRAGSSPLNFHSTATPSLGAKDVLIQLIAAPINPLDLLVLADRYPVKPHHHHTGEGIPGYDGVGKVINVGADINSIKPGDFCIPSKFGFGTWRTHAVVDASFVQKVSEPTDLAFAAILRTTVSSAFFLVEDMCDLKAGDWIIQNAATSSIAQMVVQFARRRGVHTISVIRDRGSSDETARVRSLLLQGGADIVLLDTELESCAELKNKRIRMALDSVFGDSGRSLVKALSRGGTYVQLGMLSGNSGQLKLDAASDVWGRHLTLKGFRGTSQLALRSMEEQTDLFNWIISLFNGAELVWPVLGLDRIYWDSSDVEGTKIALFDAVKNAGEAAVGQRKQLVIFGQRPPVDGSL